MENNVVLVMHGRQYCPKCKNELDDEYFVDWDYCAHCGSKLIHEDITYANIKDESKIRWKLILLAVYESYKYFIILIFTLFMFSIGLNSIWNEIEIFHHGTDVTVAVDRSINWFWHIVFIMHVELIYYNIITIKLCIHKLINYIKKKRG